ncbi:Transcription initiation factor TFIIIB [Pseudomonas syringae pv. actinidiae]|uniref:Transcription initiation factor TFIIIB n=1 Tax=Pseudomonas syringae pv. actinidiae TaxID=103796 RepID=A0AAN4Q6U6_PSESF|nr:Transcription initiation factor TFIIIB [Pseudomonas syringae pv. actinidiae]
MVLSFPLETLQVVIASPLGVLLTPATPFAGITQDCSLDNSLSLQFAAAPETVAIVPSIGISGGFCSIAFHGFVFTTPFS